MPLCKLITSVWRSSHLTTYQCNNVSQYVWLRARLTDVTVYTVESVPPPFPASLHVTSNNERWIAFQNAAYRIRRTESSVDDQQHRTNIRGWPGSCTRVASTVVPVSLTMITLLPLLTVYVGKFFISTFSFTRFQLVASFLFVKILLSHRHSEKIAFVTETFLLCLHLTQIGYFPLLSPFSIIPPLSRPAIIEFIVTI